MNNIETWEENLEKRSDQSIVTSRDITCAMCAEINALRKENESLKLRLSGKTQGYDHESYKAGMLAAADNLSILKNHYLEVEIPAREIALLVAAVDDSIDIIKSKAASLPARGDSQND